MLSIFETLVRISLNNISDSGDQSKNKLEHTARAPQPSHGSHSMEFLNAFIIAVMFLSQLQRLIDFLSSTPEFQNIDCFLSLLIR